MTAQKTLRGAATAPLMYWLLLVCGLSALTVQRIDAPPAAAEQFVEIPPPRAEHQINHRSPSAPLERGEIHELAELGQVLGPGVEHLHPGSCLSDGVASPCTRGQFLRFVLNPLRCLVQARRTVRFVKFQSIPFGRVVAGGDVDPAGSLVDANRVRDDRCWRVAIRQPRPETVTSNDFRAPSGILPGQKPRVMAHDDQGFGVLGRVLGQVSSNGVRRNLDVRKRKCITDNPTPTRRAESYDRHALHYSGRIVVVDSNAPQFRIESPTPAVY